MSRRMRLSLLTFTVTALFTNVAYQAYFPALAGLATALDRCVRLVIGDPSAKART